MDNDKKVSVETVGEIVKVEIPRIYCNSKRLKCKDVVKIVGNIADYEKSNGKHPSRTIYSKCVVERVLRKGEKNERYLKNNNLENKNFKYKDFRVTSKFNSTILELKEIYINQISPYAKFDISNTHPNDICRFLNNLSEMDITDMILCEMSKKYNAKIITNDSDYLLSDFFNGSDLYLAQ